MCVCVCDRNSERERERSDGKGEREKAIGVMVGERGVDGERDRSDGGKRGRESEDSRGWGVFFHRFPNPYVSYVSFSESYLKRIGHLQEDSALSL